VLDLNDGGKVLLSERFKPIPLSVWPVVLERVNQRKGYYDSTNVLYHLLRNGPAMGKRRDTIPASCFESVLSAVATDADFDTPVSVFKVSPLAEFLSSIPVFTSPTPSMRTRKRKISMP